ncbi:MAG: tRNA pseudouridine synthase A [Arcanobacterium sp.]|nr:tRNA pseudouridine synthase A [Arcanobacterium sp.]MDY5589696.1 tRNA pseudouridine synthase A [Arcanobacterium sp.]
MRIRLDIAYAGAGFHGWAAQPHQRTVQGELETALAAVLREPVALTVAGRTDAGVHAQGQVAHADVSAAAWAALPGRSDREPGSALVRAVNAVLARNLSCYGRPPVGEAGSQSSQNPQKAFDPYVLGLGERSPRGYSDVIVGRAAAVPESFDARFSALWRAYRYRIADSAAMWNPLSHDVLWLAEPLNVAAMHRSGRPLLGEHNFLSFCKPRAGASTVRTLQELQVERGADGVITINVRADAFCHSQVRALVGALIEVGRGAKPESWPAECLAAASRTCGVAVAPAHGLTLAHVEYPEDPEEYEKQALRARVYRGQ